MVLKRVFKLTFGKRIILFDTIISMASIVTLERRKINSRKLYDFFWGGGEGVAVVLTFNIRMRHGDEMLRMDSNILIIR